MATTTPINTETTYDVVILGAGPVGETLAQHVVEAGMTAVLVEHDLVGGDCAYYACKPSKALLRPIEVVNASRQLQGVRPTTLLVDDLLARRNELVDYYHDAQQKWAMEDAGVAVVRGHGQLTAEKTVLVHGSDGAQHTLHANRVVVLATGTVPNIPPEFEGVPVWDSKDATAVRQVPRRLIIVGGGPVACEAATWMNAMGSQVTMLVRGGTLLGGTEPFAAELVADRLGAAGVDIRFYTEVTQVSRPAGMDHGLGDMKGGMVTVRTSTSETFEADELLLATGRRPNLETINLGSVGLVPADVLEGRLPDWLHAIGDAGGVHRLTHMGKYQARKLAANLAEPDHTATGKTKTQPPTPQVVFTDPQVGFVGLTEQAAREAGYEVVTAQVDFADVKGAVLQRDDVVGGVKIVVDQATNTLLGATLVGPEAGEMLHAATLAVAARIPVATLREAVPVFPTASEVWVALLAEV